MAKRYYRTNDEPPKEGWVKYGYKWISPEEAKMFIHPKEFNPEFKEICRLSKKHSPYTVIFQIDPMNLEGEDWFIMCSYVKKNGKVGKSSTLIRKDVGGWIRGLQSMEKYGEPKWSKDYQDMDKNQELFNINCI